MKLAIEWPSTWTVNVLPNFTEVIVTPELTIRERSIALPADVASWMHAVMIEDAPADTESRVVSATKQQSNHGWPISVMHYTFEDDAGTVVEERIGTFYRLLYNLAEVVVRAKQPAQLPAELPRIQELVLAAKVAWARHPASTLHGLLGL
jgi:hypothetical protein